MGTSRPAGTPKPAGRARSPNDRSGLPLQSVRHRARRAGGVRVWERCRTVVDRYGQQVIDQPTAKLVERIETLPHIRVEDEAHRARNWRRVGLALLWLVVAAAVTGVLGVRMGTSTASADGWTLEVEAPQITRGALDAPITITVSRESGFGDKVTLRVDRILFEHLDVNLIAPAPSAETGSLDQVEWTFDPPDGEVMTVSIDARMSPSEMPGIDRLGFAVIERGEVAVEVRPRLVLLP